MPDGLSEVIGNLDRLPKAITADALQATTASGTEILEIAQRNCPVRTGRLRDSGYVKVLGFEVEVGFSAPYAADVHEDTSADHSTGEAKFLETPFKDASRTLLNDIAREAAL